MKNRENDGGIIEEKEQVDDKEWRQMESDIRRKIVGRFSMRAHSPEQRAFPWYYADLCLITCSRNNGRLLVNTH